LPRHEGITTLHVLRTHPGRHVWRIAPTRGDYDGFLGYILISFNKYGELPRHEGITTIHCIVRHRGPSTVWRIAPTRGDYDMATHII